MLYRSNKLMYDRQTHTLWHQFLGEPAVGPLADSGIVLEVLPVLVTTWAEWLAEHPDTTVLALETGVYPPSSYASESDRRSIYFYYRRDPETMFPVFQRSDLLTTKSQVLGLKVDGQTRAYPLDLLLQEPVINDSLGGQNLVVVTSPMGGGARAYQRDEYEFSLAPGRDTGEGLPILADQHGQLWQVREDALAKVDNPKQLLPRLPAHIAYWFGWYAFYPGTEVYGMGGPTP